jgi:hypothetical protein
MKRYLLIFGLGIFLFTSCAAPAPAAGTKVVVVNKAPRNHKVVVVKGKRYYVWNGNHYRKTRNGYVLVKLR